MRDTPYEVGHGWALNGVNFSHHKLECKQCQRFDEKKPATLALLCLDGAIFWKREHAKTEREEAPYDPNRLTKDAARKAMRYK